MRYALLILTIFIASACIDRVELPIRAEELLLVVEGQITNEAPPYVIRLAYTRPYNSGSEPYPGETRVGDAQEVRVSDDLGRSTRFALNGAGLYQSVDTTFRGQVGRTYSLTVVLRNGNRYVTTPERMPAVSVIDSLSGQPAQSTSFVAPYQVNYRVTTQDPPGERNYYRWTAYGLTSRLSTGVSCGLGSSAICNNRCWTTVSSTDVNVYSDDAINGNPIRNRFVLQLPIYSLAPQFVEVQQYGITQANYQFWKLYQQQGKRSGSIFDPLPAPIAGNLVNANNVTDRARGYFAVTSVTRLRLRKDNFGSPFYRALATWVLNQYIPIGDCRVTYGPVPTTLPPGWP